jgi:molybdopterin-containing oxidoreductase family membrane subunit
MHFRAKHGWKGSAKHWSRYETVSLVLAGVSTPVLGAHYQPDGLCYPGNSGWHTIFLLTVVGAISDAVLTLMFH